MPETARIETKEVPFGFGMNGSIEGSEKTESEKAFGGENGTVRRKRTVSKEGRMKLALCQMNILWEEKEENFRRARGRIREAKEAGAKLILFPEMSFTGFSMNIEKTAERERETFHAVRQIAMEYGIAVGFGWAERAGRKARNHYTVTDGRGEILCDYVKLHPFSYSGEDCFFEAGQELVSFSMGNLQIGILLCYDLRFPEPFQILAKNCDLIAVPANWPEKRREHWKCLLQARAVECQVYLAGVNCCGSQKGLSYTGDSCVFAPDGSRLAGFLEEEGSLFSNIPEDVQKYRESFPVRRDRRWELYRRWYSDWQLF